MVEYVGKASDLGESVAVRAAFWLVYAMQRKQVGVVGVVTLVMFHWICECEWGKGE